MTKSRDLANAATALNAVTATEIGYVDGVTSAIQTQLDAKLASATAATTYQAINANVSTTELGYLDGVTSAIQTQLDAKTAKSILTNTGDIYYASSANTPARLGIGSTGNVLTVASGIPSWAAPASASFVGVRVQQAAATQSIPNATGTEVVFTGTENFDTDGFHSGTTNTARLTVPTGKAGYYKIYGVCQFVPNATGRRAWGLTINGTTPITANELSPSSVAYLAGVVNTTYYLNNGDWVAMTVYQESGGNLNLDGNQYNFFGMEKIG